jgi:hypothetical protein
LLGGRETLSGIRILGDPIEGIDEPLLVPAANIPLTKSWQSESLRATNVRIVE